jgi:transcriptional regulator with XRE-family HTH domain
MAPPFDETRFFAAIEGKRKAEGLSWRELGRRLKLSPSTFSRLSRGRRPDVETFLRLVGWLDMPAELFVRGEKPLPRKRKSTMAEIARALRQDPLLDAEGVAPLEEVLRVLYARFSLSRERRSRG